MVKVVTFLKRKAGMSVEDFQRYWRTRHPEVVVRLPGVRRYVQSHTLAVMRDGTCQSVQKFVDGHKLPGMHRVDIRANRQQCFIGVRKTSVCDRHRCCLIFKD